MFEVRIIETEFVFTISIGIHQTTSVYYYISVYIKYRLPKITHRNVSKRYLLGKRYPGDKIL